MKVTSEVKKEDYFSPFNLNIEFNSQEEVNKFYALFNWTPIVEALNIGPESDSIRKSISKHNANVVYAKWFEKLSKTYK